MKIKYALMGLLLPQLSFAQEIITIESTITGSHEQPKVISIVPWQEPEDPEYVGSDIMGLGIIGTISEPIDRDTFNRERRYISSVRKLDDS